MQQESVGYNPVSRMAIKSEGKIDLEDDQLFGAALNIFNELFL